MKLTKGKISRLYNKKKQSLKKHKKLKSSYKKRTFRNKRKVNLARKSLKRLHYRKYKGGEGESDDTPKDATTEQPVTNTDVDTTELPVTNTDIDTTEQPVTNTDNDTNKSSEGVLDVPIQPAEKISDTDVENVTEKEDDEEPTDTNEEDEEPTDTNEDAEEPTETEEDTSNQPSQEVTESTGDVGDKSNTELINSFKTIANYIADAVAEKVSISQSGEKPQEGFDAVNKAAETMATSGGSKFKKTRRFRLTKKNKTRHS